MKLQIEIEVPDGDPIKTKPAARWIGEYFNTHDPELFSEVGRNCFAGPEPDYDSIPDEDLDLVWRWVAKEKISDCFHFLQGNTAWCVKLLEIVNQIKERGLHRVEIPIWAWIIMDSILYGYADLSSDYGEYEPRVFLLCLEGNWREVH